MDTCKFEVCDKPTRALGLCQGHYKQSQRDEYLTPLGSRLGVNKKVTSRPCIVEGCGRYRISKEGHCQTHYLQYKRGEELHGIGSENTGTCEICGKFTLMHWDHDHKTGLFRGYLCTNCNTGIGNLQDDPKILQKAIAYLS